MYGQSKKPPQTPGQFKLIDQMKKSKSYFEQFLDPELVSKNIDAQFKAIDEKNRINFDKIQNEKGQDRAFLQDYLGENIEVEDPLKLNKDFEG